MNDLTLLREAGPEAPPLSPAARSAARAALLAEIEGPAPRRRPRRGLVVRTGVAAVAVAAAWTAAVVIAAPDGPGTPATSVTLVDFEMPTFPLSLEPAPPGLRPAFDGDGDGATIASYDDAAMENGFTVYVGEDAPESTGQGDDGAPGYQELDVDAASLGDDEVEVVTYERNWCVEDTATGCVTERRRFAWLSWERRDDQWVSLLGHGDYADAEQLQEVAGSLVDRPQPATLDVGLAPEGWSIRAYKMGRVLTLVNDAYEAQELTVHIPLPEDVIPADEIRESVSGPMGPQLDVTVNGRPAQLVRVDIGYVVDGHRYEGWYLQSQFEDGTTFVLQAPEAFTQEQVLQMAEQVTYNP
ncbi:hypothetical protein QOZ88_20520 [Blastococcus sp. BMG 814]|uniref:DUF4367 domain-containing protein n=1 Tax=Blastococcus carthaginiensis TaxID=3050034 RepID=A0ABT9IHH0_9ACTN|nr:hypothetical protein [Blastococcus carthaginiensis]MDP5185026.1 hypothetical protein [Blastococcus carthaginiensis]